MDCNPEYKESVQKLVEDVGLDGFVEFVGPVPHSELNRQYAWADVFLFASLFENWGMVLHEAVATGLPCITTNVGCVPSVCT